jgi:hypothetical protein
VRKKRSRYLVIGGLLAAALLIAFAAGVLTRTPSNLALGLYWMEPGADGYTTVAAWLTNQSEVTVFIDGVRFEWVEPSGHLASCHAINEGWQHNAQPGDVVGTYCSVPTNAKKVRIVVCGEVRFVRKQIGNLVSKLHLPSWCVRGLYSNGHVYRRYPRLHNPGSPT